MPITCIFILCIVILRIVNWLIFSWLVGSSCCWHLIRICGIHLKFSILVYFILHALRIWPAKQLCSKSLGVSLYGVYCSQFHFMCCMFREDIVQVLGKWIRISLSKIQITYVITIEKFRPLQIPPGRTCYARGKVGRLPNLWLEFTGRKQKWEIIQWTKACPCLISSKSENTRSITCPLCILLYPETAKVVKSQFILLALNSEESLDFIKELYFNFCFIIIFHIKRDK